MDNWFLQELVKVSSSVIDAVIKNCLIPLSEGYFSGIVRELNIMVANEAKNNEVFEVPLGSNGAALNLTMTTATQMAKNQDLLVINFDGLVDKLANGVSNKNIRGDIKNYAPRLQHSDSEQFWIHEDTFSSVFQTAPEMLFPMESHSENLAKEINAAVPQIKSYYGADASVFAKISMEAGSEKAVKFSMKDGAVIGNGATTTIDVICSNSTTVNETALSFSSSLQIKSDTYLKNFVLFPKVNDHTLANSKITKNVIGVDSSKAGDLLE